MKKNIVPAVHCEYAKAGERLDQILDASFRLYLKRILALAESNAGSGAR